MVGARRAREKHHASGSRTLKRPPASLAVATISPPTERARRCASASPALLLPARRLPPYHVRRARRCARVRGLDAEPVVDDVEHHRAVVRTDRDPDAAVPVPAGVLHERAEDAFDQVPVHADPRGGRRCIQLQRDAVSLGEGRAGRHGPICRLARITRPARPGLRAGGRDERVDGAGHLGRVVEDRREVPRGTPPHHAGGAGPARRVRTVATAACAARGRARP